IRHDRMHGRHIFGTRQRFETRMRVPFPEIVEASKVGGGAREESVELSLMFGGVPYEMNGRASRMLDREVDQAERLACDVFAHQEAADLETAALAQFTLQSIKNPKREQEVHSSTRTTSPRHAPSPRP